MRRIKPNIATKKYELEPLKTFMDELGGEMIIKPLDGKGGEGIFHVSKGERNLNSILEQSTQYASRWVMAQRYLPAVRQGDKRILLLEGEVLGAVLRVPSDSEVRANLHIGFFVGIDVIGGRLTEVNVTSPTGVQEINQLDGVRLEESVIQRAEALVRARD